MKKLGLSTLLIAGTALAQFEPSDQRDRRIMPEDAQMRIEAEYKRLYEQSVNENSSIQNENTKLQEEVERLKELKQNATIKNAAQSSVGAGTPETPSSLGNSLGNVPGNKSKSSSKSRVRSAPTKRLASGVQVFSVSEEADAELTVLPAGSWVRAKLLTGVQANAKYPYNVLLQLDHAYTGPNGVKVPLTGCLILGGATADLSIERVIISPHTLSCVRDSGEYLQRKVQGFVAGKDSSNGMMGVYDSKQGQVFLQAVLAGVVKGASEAYQIANTTTTLAAGPDGTQTPVTNFNGSSKQLAVAKGVGDSAQMVTQWYLEQAKALLPTIHVGSGQDVWVVMTDKVDIPDLTSFDDY